MGNFNWVYSIELNDLHGRIHFVPKWNAVFEMDLT